MPLDAAERDAVLSPSGTVPRQPPPDPGASRPRDAKGPTERRPFDSAVPGRRPANRVLPLHPDPADPLAAPAPLRHPAPRNAAVDVWVPCYNEDPALLEACCDSLDAQDYPVRLRIFLIDVRSPNREQLRP